MKNTSLKNYKAVILAGGKGTRLYPITKEVPKPLLPINKKPIINYLVDLFKSYGIKEIAVLISNEDRQDFKWWKKRHYPSSLRSSGRAPSTSISIRLMVEKEPLGTFGGLHLLKDWIGNSKFFLTNGDEIKKIDLNKMTDLHNNLATIALVQVENPQDYGVVVCEGEKVKEFLEKPPFTSVQGKTYINSGLYLLNPEILDYCKLEFLMIEKDIFPKLAREGKLGGFKFNGYWTDCGTWDRYEKAIQVPIDTY